MTDIELRIKVAELVGYRRFENDRNAWWHPTSHCSRTPRQLPDYPNDLNAMHEVEQKCLLTDDAWEAYRGYLLRDPTNFPSSRFAAQLSPTARQRAEAFVKVMENGL